MFIYFHPLRLTTMRHGMHLLPAPHQRPFYRQGAPKCLCIAAIPNVLPPQLCPCCSEGIEACKALLPSSHSCQVTYPVLNFPSMFLAEQAKERHGKAPEKHCSYKNFMAICVLPKGASFSNLALQMRDFNLFISVRR